MLNRYESPEIWRSNNIFQSPKKDAKGKHPPPPPRPEQHHPNEFGAPAEYLEQTLVADYPSEKIEDIFLMLKTGGTVMWERLPIHLFTTFTRVKNFAIYSDMAGSIGGYEVIDILKDLPDDVIRDDQLTSYRLLNKVHKGRYGWSPQDIDFHDRSDGWNNDKFKNLPMLYDAYQKSPESKWFVFMDDDTYLLWDNLVEYLSSMNHTERIYLGSRAWMPMKEHHGESTGVFAHGGSGVVISKAAMDAVFGPEAAEDPKEMLDHWAHTALYQCCGDIITGWVLFELANCTLDEYSVERPITRFQGEPLETLHYGSTTMCEPLMSFHHVTNHEIELIWEYERLHPNGTPLKYKDFYRDMVLPWVVEEREDWYMRHHSYTITKNENMPFYDKDHQMIYPNETKEDCRKACEKHETCFVWSWWLGTCELKHEYWTAGIKADQDFEPYKGVFGDAPKVYTGWMVDRIRQVRASLECDPLEYDEETGRYNDDPTTSEGWALRVANDAEGVIPSLHDAEGVVPGGAGSSPSGAAQETGPTEGGSNKADS